MAFASKFVGMLYLASYVAVLTLASNGGCIAATTIEFESPENFPPSVISEPNAEYPLNRIARIDLDDPVEIPEMPLEVIIRDPNFDQTLDYRIFLDAPEPPAAEIEIQDGEIEPSGFLERPRTFTISYNELDPGECHRIELVVVGAFASNVEKRRPVDEGDIDEATWWVEVVDADNPVINEQCR